MTIAGQSPLHKAVRLRQHATAAELLGAGADPNAVSPPYRRTAFHYAALSADAEMVALLLARGADVARRDGYGRTALLLATSNPLGDAIVYAVIITLAGSGAAIDERDDEGATALHAAAFEGSSGAVRALLERGADANAADANGVTALHAAAANAGGSSAQDRWVRVAELLIGAGANVSAKTSGSFVAWSTRHAKGKTPLDLARRHRHQELESVLVRSGATKG